MGLFQTLREQGALPLAAVGPRGELEEVLDGMGGACPWVFDRATLRAVRPPACPPRSGLLERARCDPAAEPWCVPGAVVSARRAAGGPIVVTFAPASVQNAWGHLYRALTDDVRDRAELEGACFRRLLVGKSSILNFYQAINGTEPAPEQLAMHPRVDFRGARVEAMAVFKAWVTAAQREWVAAERAAGSAAPAVTWAGYSSPGAERLRAGVSRADLAADPRALDAIFPKEVPGMLREEMEDLRKAWATRAAATQPEVDRFREAYGGAAAARAAAAAAGEEPAAALYDDYDAAAERERARLNVGGGAGAGGGAGGAVAGGVVRGFDESRRRLQSADSVGRNSSAGGDLAAAAPPPLPPARRRRLLWPFGRRANAAARSGAAAASVAGAPHRWFDAHAAYAHERPRPVVAYCSRNFFSRGVLNEADVLHYILDHYDVTLKVTTYEEPLLAVMDLLGRADAVLGMHGAGWTNALFLKRGAAALQLFPYGWRLATGATVRGFNYREIALASEARYSEWVSPGRAHAFFRRIDFPKVSNLTFSLHPDPSWPLPEDSWPGNAWIYQNTYADMASLGPAIDELMAAARIPRVEGAGAPPRAPEAGAAAPRRR
jgi:hypothetical protein